MSKKQYNLILGNIKIGITNLEKADASMGVIFGKIYFSEITSGFDFFSKYCRENGIKVTEYPVDRFITTFDILELKVIDENGNEIKGERTSVDGADSDAFDITVVGIPYPFYEQEFPHHVKENEERFKNSN